MFCDLCNSAGDEEIRLLSQCAHVALLIDNRSEFRNELMKVEAVTATGRAELIDDDSDIQHWSDLLTERHPYLKSFVHSSSCVYSEWRYCGICTFFAFRRCGNGIPGGSG